MEDVRKYHNNVKRHLIQSTTIPGARVLDVGCGFGGDLQKWAKCGAVLELCDPSREALAEARQRAASLKLKVTFYEGDIHACPEKLYNVICYNFSLHYIFQSRDMFFKSIRAIRRRMQAGSLLIGCIPDVESILMSTPFMDSLGNTVVRGDETGYGHFGERLSVYLADTPFYKEGAKMEPIAYKDLLVTHLAELGVRLVSWQPLTEYAISRLYSTFIFACS